MKRNLSDVLTANRDRQYQNLGSDTRLRRIVLLARKDPATLRSSAARWSVTLLVLAGAAMLLWSGVIHLQLWAGGYRDIAVIGPLFLAQGVGAVVIGAALAFLRRLALIVAGAATLAATAAGLLISAYIGLFGYQESLAVPDARSSLVIEFTGAALLAVAAVFVTTASPRVTHPGRL